MQEKTILDERLNPVTYVMIKVLYQEWQPIIHCKVQLNIENPDLAYNYLPF